MIGNSIEINNLSVKIEVARDNGDNRLMHFIIGRIFYRLMDFDPIEEAPMVTETPWTRVYKLLETVVYMKKQYDKNPEMAMGAESKIRI